MVFTLSGMDQLQVPKHVKERTAKYALVVSAKRSVEKANHGRRKRRQKNKHKIVSLPPSPKLQSPRSPLPIFPPFPPLQVEAARVEIPGLDLGASEPTPTHATPIPIEVVESKKPQPQSPVCIIIEEDDAESFAVIEYIDGNK